jgi:hypothetical protein
MGCPDLLQRTEYIFIGWGWASLLYNPLSLTHSHGPWACIQIDTVTMKAIISRKYHLYIE